MTSETAIYLSPHLDDAVLSCGGAIAQRTERGQRVLVATLCTGEPARIGPFAQHLHRIWGLSVAEAVHTRRSEDCAALAQLGAEPTHLGFLDAIYREPDVYDCDERLYGEIRDDATYVAGVCEAVLELDSRYRPVSWFAPLAIGTHVDHQIGFVCGRELSRHGANVAFYEDVPYVFRTGSLEHRLHQVGGGASYQSEMVHLSYAEQEAKLSAIRKYASQFADHDALARSMREYAAAPGESGFAERVWRAERTASASLWAACSGSRAH